MSDLREELQSRIASIQQAVNSFRAEKEKIDQALKDAESKLMIWRTAYEMEAERLGDLNVPMFMRDGKLRFAGKKLSEALTIIRKEHPQITKKEAAKMLGSEGFDFRGKKPVRMVHGAWIALDRKAKEGGA